MGVAVVGVVIMQAWQLYELVENLENLLEERVKHDAVMLNAMVRSLELWHETLI